LGYIEIAEHLVGKVIEPDYKIIATDEKRLLLKEKLNSLGIREDSLVCIHPGAGKIYKQWPVECFSKLADFIVDMGYNVIFIGSTKDMVNAQIIQSLMKNSSCNLVNRLTLGELIALFERTLLYIGNDSGPLHLASQTGTPVIGLFGSADENRWGPLGKNSIVLRGAERCPKCKGKDCKHDFRCIRELKVETVINTVKSIISNVEGIGKDVS
jgi:heptosyltransferase-3